MNRSDREQLRPSSTMKRELERMSDWELERGLASSDGFDQDRRIKANLVLRERYTGPEQGIAFWILAVSALEAGVGALLLLK